MVNNHAPIVHMRLIDFKQEWLGARIEVPAPTAPATWTPAMPGLRGTVTKIGTKYTVIRRTDSKADVTVATSWLMEQVAFNRVKRLKKAK
jgi:small-conductance mechanosensitive channel